MLASEKEIKVAREESTKCFLNGTHRSRDPADTLERIKPYLPIMGITRVANVTGLDRIGIPVTIASRPNSRSVAISQGKGISLKAAMASALMESIETYHAENIMLPLMYASHEEMRYSHDLVDVENLPWVRESKFHGFLQLLWIEATNLRNNEPLWLPYELVHTNYVRPLPPGSGCFLASSNGLASGNNVMEAICHAICEVIERDSVSLWTVSPDKNRDACRIDLKTINDNECNIMLDKFESAGIDVAVWDVTSDIGIPTMLVWIMENGTQEIILERPSVGAGCHPNKDIALSRALSEAAQERLTLISGSRDDLKRSYYDRMDVRHVFEKSSNKDFEKTPTYSFGASNDDVDFLLEKLTEVGVDQVMFIDLSKDHFSQISVVRVVIPKLEGVVDDPRYLPGKRAQKMSGKSS